MTNTTLDITQVLKFKPIFKEKLWGGQKLKTILNKDYGNLPNCGETWEISGVEGNISIVEGGVHHGKSLTKLIEEYKADLLGEKVFKQFGTNFPLLIKFIDANADLSIQVHPDDSLAKKRHNSFGKTEMWYVVEADKDASLISGFNQEMSKEKYLSYFNNGKLTEILNKEEAKQGDVFFLPAGRVHNIGKGLLIAEIQQTSDITYRIYDFDRKDSDGSLRKLHTDEALEAIDYRLYPEYKSPYTDRLEQVNQLISCSYFETNKLNLTKPLYRDYSNINSFRVLMFLEGKATLHCHNESYSIKKGDVLLIPAKINSIEIVPSLSTTLLETYVPVD